LLKVFHAKYSILECGSFNQIKDVSEKKVPHKPLFKFVKE
jgi:hypothetical protein